MSSDTMLLGDKGTFNILSDKEKVRKIIKFICFCLKLRQNSGILSVPQAPKRDDKMLFPKEASKKTVFNADSRIT